MSVVDKEKALIELVYAKRLLYDSSDPMHTNYFERDKAWSAISEELQVPDARCRFMWKRFKAEFKKRFLMAADSKSIAQPTTTENSMCVIKPRKGFRHYEELSFLIDHIDFGVKNQSIKQEYPDRDHSYMDTIDDNSERTESPVHNEEFEDLSVMDTSYRKQTISPIHPKTGKRNHDEEIILRRPETNHVKSSPIKNSESIGNFFQSVEKLMRTANFTQVELIETQVEILESIREKMCDNKRKKT